jgi:hypothetical protein
MGALVLAGCEEGVGVNAKGENILTKEWVVVRVKRSR